MAKVTMAGIERRLCDDEVLLKEHDKILVRGNGEPSLQEKLRNIENYIKEDRENRKYYSRLFATITITNLVALLFAAFVWFVKIYPLLEHLKAVEVVVK